VRHADQVEECVSAANAIGVGIGLQRVPNDACGSGGQSFARLRPNECRDTMTALKHQWHQSAADVSRAASDKDVLAHRSAQFSKTARENQSLRKQRNCLPLRFFPA
jgi:hypothetical protein